MTGVRGVRGGFFLNVHDTLDAVTKCDAVEIEYQADAGLAQAEIREHLGCMKCRRLRSSRILSRRGHQAAGS